MKPILERLEKGEIQALDLLNLKILEPAMGAAAFHNEVINQLSRAYLTYRQQELKQQVDPNKYQEELQKIKAHIALNNVYGVDLNPTAVELGKLSLWLNVIHKDMQTPFFGYRLGVGNAVVGSWLKVFKHKDFSFEAKGANGFVKKDWWNIAPKHLQFGKKGILRREDEIYHFLLPDIGMASSGGIKLLKDAYPEEAKRVTDWRREFTTPLSKDEFVKLHRISLAIDALLLEHYDIQKNIALVTEANADYFGNPNKVMELDFQSYSYEQKQNFAQERLKPNAPYYKLKQIMDYWCSLWFWDVRDAKDLPTRKEWYEDIVQILNIDLATVETSEVSEEEAVRDYRKDKKALEKQLVEALKQSPSSLFENERSVLVKKYADQYRYFHYELEFIEVFRENNGFDVAVGNPPWVKIEFEEADVIVDSFPEIEIRKISAALLSEISDKFISIEPNLYYQEIIFQECLKSYLSEVVNFPPLKGQKSNLYKNVLYNCLMIVNDYGVVGILHPESVYDDPSATAFRKLIYKRLISHYQFQNQLFLFAEVGHRFKFSINIYRGKDDDINFDSINNLFHPSTISNSYIHNSNDECKGIKVKAENGFVWNLEGHKSRIINHNEDSLRILSNLFENSDNWESAKLAVIHSKEIINALEKLANINRRVYQEDYIVSVGWFETNDVKKGIIKRKTKDISTIEDYELIYSGPHFYVSNPLYKTPRAKCTEKSHYDVIDHSTVEENYYPRTNYVPIIEKEKYVSDSRNKGFNKNENYLEYYRVINSKMLNQAAERTLQSALIPPKIGHIDGIYSIAFKEISFLMNFACYASSLVMDYYVKLTGANNLTDSIMKYFPIEIHKRYKSDLYLRVLLLNCINEKYSDLWYNIYEDFFQNCKWSIVDDRLFEFKNISKQWDFKNRLSNYFERRLALVEIDVLIAMNVNISLEALCLMYESQFPVLRQNEEDTWYDTKGNIVFTCSKGLVGVGLDRADWEKIKDFSEGETYEHTITKSELYQGEKMFYYAPFIKCDRVEDYKIAWAHFEKKFK